MSIGGGGGGPAIGAAGAAVTGAAGAAVTGAAAAAVTGAAAAAVTGAAGAAGDGGVGDGRSADGKTPVEVAPDPGLGTCANEGTATKVEPKNHSPTNRRIITLFPMRDSVSC